MVGVLVELRDPDRIVVPHEWLGRAIRTEVHAKAEETG
jgi:hypothetical protein